MTEIKEFDSNALSPVEVGRSDLLRDFDQDPDSDLIWQLAYDEVRKEGDAGFDGSIASDIPVTELIEFAERVRAQSTIQARYALTAETASNGRMWFDILETFSDPQSIAAKLSFYKTVQSKKKSAIPFENSMEIGIGVGNSIGYLDSFSDHVVGIDNVPELLTNAKKSVSTNTELVQADATSMPFASASFDLIESSGVSYALDHEDVSKLFKEVNRLLKPGGVYLETIGSRDSLGRIDPDLMKSYTSAKSMLAQMLVDYISGEQRLKIGVSEENRMTIIDSLGLKHLTWVLTNYNGERVYLRLLAKPLDAKGTLPSWIGKIQNRYVPVSEQERTGWEHLVEEGKAIRLKSGAYKGVPQSQWPQNIKK